MPALVVAFTAAAWLMGVVLRGTDVLVNQLSVVQGAAWSAVGGGVSDARVDVLRWEDGRHLFLKSGEGDPSA